jgi:hypothetical protein
MERAVQTGEEVLNESFPLSHASRLSISRELPWTTTFDFDGDAPAQERSHGNAFGPDVASIVRKPASANFRRDEPFVS